MINENHKGKQTQNWISVFEDILFTFLVFTECSLDMSESGKTLAYMTHYWGSKDSSLSKCTWWQCKDEGRQRDIDRGWVF